MGGEINAFTSKEHTCYHTSTLADDFDIAIEVLSELFSKATLNPEDFEKERSVVLQEILMAKDDIEDRVFDTYFEKCFSGHPLGRTILGSESSLEKITRDQVYEWYRQVYKPENLIISVVGAIDHHRVVEAIEKKLGSLKAEKSLEKRNAPLWKPWRELYQKPHSEQVHVLLGLPGQSYGHIDRFNGLILNAYLGGGMTSKLYQKIREEQGWAYSVFSMLNTYTDCGLELLYAATDSDLYQKVLQCFFDELADYKKQKISKEDLEFFRRQTKGQILISSEDIENRMNSLAINEMIFGEYRSVASVISEMDKVTLDSVNHYLTQSVDVSQYQVFVFGDLPKEDEAYIKSM